MNKLKNFKNLFNNQWATSSKRGVALLMTLFFIVFMSFIATNISYETIVDYNVSSQQVNRLKAYYAAKSGIEISLLRIFIYQKALNNLPPSLGLDSSVLDPIWNFPLAWPPSNFVGDNVNITEAILNQIKKAESESFMEAQYLTTIESEDFLIDINDLAAPSKKLREATARQILRIFEIEIENNKDFSKKYIDEDFSQLVNNLVDWVDEDVSQNNGSGRESLLYQDAKPTQKGFNLNYFPANQPFKTLQELHMVAGMNTDYFNLLKSKITLYGAKGMNINYASAEVLKALSVEITDEIALKIIDRRNGEGNFKNKEDFFTLLESLDVSIKSIGDGGIPLYFDQSHNFRIKSTGDYNRSQKEIEVVTYNFEKIKERFVAILEKEDESSNESEPLKKTKKAKKVSIKSRPRIVFWDEN